MAAAVAALRAAAATTPAAWLTALDAAAAATSPLSPAAAVAALTATARTPPGLGGTPALATLRAAALRTALAAAHDPADWAALAGALSAVAHDGTYIPPAATNAAAAATLVPAPPCGAPAGVAALMTACADVHADDPHAWRLAHDTTGVALWAGVQAPALTRLLLRVASQARRRNLRDATLAARYLVDAVATDDGVEDGWQQFVTHALISPAADLPLVPAARLLTLAAMRLPPATSVSWRAAAAGVLGRGSTAAAATGTPVPVPLARLAAAARVVGGVEVPSSGADAWGQGRRAPPPRGSATETTVARALRQAGSAVGCWRGVHAQVPVAGYTVDFLLPPARDGVRAVAVEVEGPRHAAPHVLSLSTAPAVSGTEFCAADALPFVPPPQRESGDWHDAVAAHIRALNAATRLRHASLAAAGVAVIPLPASAVQDARTASRDTPAFQRYLTAVLTDALRATLGA